MMMVEVPSWCPTALLFSENMENGGAGRRERETLGDEEEREVKGWVGGPFVNKGSFR